MSLLSDNKDDKMTDTIIFVCEHGAAKSIIAAAYFNKLAEETNIDVRAIARGTHPDNELSPNTIKGLRADGLTPIESVPQKLSPNDLQSAQQIISFCELPEEYQNKIPIEQWNDVPPVSQNYETARDTIRKHLNQLLNK
jgi:protein-tyrosine-phosphatase